jgi:hypothetical protein
MIKNAEHVGYSTLQELSEEVRAAQTDGARTGRIFDVNNLDADTRMSLPFGMGKLLAEGHTLTVDYAGNINLSDNPDAQTRAGNGMNLFMHYRLLFYFSSALRHYRKQD